MLKSRGRLAVYTEESYKRHHEGRSEIEDGRQLRYLNTKDGKVPRIVVWEGEGDV